MSKIFSEIHAQYAAIDQTRALIDARFAKLKALMDAPGMLVFTGCGSSYSICCSAALTAQLRLGRPAMAIASGDLLLHIDEYRAALEGCTLVVISRSGETSEAILAIEAMRAAGIPFRLLGVPCVENSTLTKVSDLAMEMPWAFDESVCQTRTVSCLYFFCAYLIARLSGDGALLRDLADVAAGGDEYLKRIEPQMKAVAQGPWTHAVVLGDAELCGILDEAALTYKEICQLPSNHYRLLDVRHGPMVMIKKDTLVVIALSDAGSRLELDLVRDVMAKGATVVCYCDEPLDIAGAVCVGFGRKLSAPARGVPCVNICQLISYYKSFETGANPDQPDGLDAWIKL